MTREEYARNPDARNAYNREGYHRRVAQPEWRQKRLDKQKASYERAKAEGRCVICRTAAAIVGLKCKPCSERKKNGVRGWIQKLRMEVYAAYGGAMCACCGEMTPDFLSLDHINGGGTLDRKTNGTGGSNVYARLKREGFPPGYQVLCFNCNWGRHRNGGVCPHQVPQCRRPS